MRIVIDINDEYIARWGSLFIHPLSYDGQSVKMFTPGFDFGLVNGQPPFMVNIAPSPQLMQQAPQQPFQPQQPQQQMPQAPTPPQQNQFPAPQLPQNYPPPQLPQNPQPPGIPQEPIGPPSYVPRPEEVAQQSQSQLPENRPVQPEELSSQQPTKSHIPPLSIVTPDDEVEMPTKEDPKNEDGSAGHEETDGPKT